MTIAADPRYRSIRLAFTNNDARGNEFIQLYAKILGGAWELVRTFAVAGVEQVSSWDTALPVASYNLAMRYVNVNVPGAGFEGSPDDWTSPFAADGKTTLLTVSAAVTWGTANFTDSSTPINLNWSSAQQGAPYLLEKNAGAGWVTVAADLVATSYLYTIPAAELGTIVSFRLTAQRAAVVGPTAGTLAVPMYIVVGQPTWSSATFTPATRTAALVWTAASNATSYLLEKNAGAGWVTVATTALPSYDYPVPDAEINTSVSFRVTGKNGAVSGTVSTTQILAMTLVVGAPVLDAPTWTPSVGYLPLTWSAASNATSYLVEKNLGAGWVSVATTSSAFYNYTPATAELNTTVSFRVTGKNGSISGTPSNTQAVALTVAIGTPTLTLGSFAEAAGTQGLSWTAGANATGYLVEKNVAAAGWVSVATLGAVTSYSYEVPAAEANVAVQFRVTGVYNGVLFGTASNVVSQTFTITTTAPTISSLDAFICYDPSGTCPLPTLGSGGFGPYAWGFNVSWAASGAPSGFDLNYCTAYGADCSPSSSYSTSDGSLRSAIFYVSSSSAFYSGWHGCVSVTVKTLGGRLTVGTSSASCSTFHYP